MKKFILPLLLLSYGLIQAQLIESEPKKSAVQKSVRTGTNSPYLDNSPGSLSTLSVAIVDQYGNILLNGWGGTLSFPSSVLSLANTGIVTLSGSTTPALITDTGKTNTGYVQIKGKTSGSLKITTADATAQAVVITVAAQTVGGATLTIPNQLGVNSTLSGTSTAVLTAGATPAFAPGSAISTYTLTPGEDETIAATITNAVSGKIYSIVITATASSRTLTFGTNFSTTGTLATGTDATKGFTIHFIFDGTKFRELGRTAAQTF